MRIAFYNTMFSMDGRSFWGNVLGHWAVHYQSNVKRLLRRIDVSRTIQTIKKSRADIMGICEVVEGQEHEVEKGLRKLGYKYIFFSNGHNLKCGKLGIRVVIASKLECRVKESGAFPVVDKFAGGGGFIDCYFPKLKLNVLCVHFSFPRDEALYKRQMDFLRRHIKKITGKFILMGDFNKTYKELAPHFKELKLASGRHKTCSTTSVLRVFHFKDKDHILVRGLKAIKKGSIFGFSDHKLIYADLN